MIVQYKLIYVYDESGIIGVLFSDNGAAHKAYYDVVIRGLTTFAPSPRKALFRGGFRSVWDLYKRGLLHN